jgi:hypothetical protein
MLFGILQSAITAIGVYFFDFFAGSATAGFGIQGKVPGTGMFFVYMLGYFNALVVILPILLIKRFGVGAMVYLPYAVVGFFVEYYYEWLKEPVLVGPLAVVGWCLFGIATGFSADLTFRFLPTSLDERLRSVLMGVVLGAAHFVLTVVALRFFYTSGLDTKPGSFVGVAYFGLPWLIANSTFGGYTAWAISKGLAVSR